MNVAIVTQPLLGNYGGLLQSFALQRILIQNNFCPITLDYLPKKPLRLLTKQFLASFYNGTISDLTLYYERTTIMNSFVHKNILTSVPIHSYNLFDMNASKIEAVIVGSDQVWRPKYNDNVLYDMYLSFLKDYSCKKLAYAASLGVDYWEYSTKQTKLCSKLIEQFDAVSVREKSAIKLIQDNLGYESVKHVLDPTLLISQEEYMELCKEEEMLTNRFIGCYILDKSTFKAEVINQMSSNLQIPYTLCSNYITSDMSVEQWLAMFRDSEYIITDSFHGAVFSIIFRKQFIVITNDIRGGDRFTSLLSLLNLNDRIIHSIDEIESLAPIEYTSVYKILNKYRTDSIDFLLSSLK